MLRAGNGNKKEKRILRADCGSKMVFNAASSFNKLWNAEVLSK